MFVKMQWSYATVQLTFYMDQDRKTRVYHLTFIPMMFIEDTKTPEDVRQAGFQLFLSHSCPPFPSLCPEHTPPCSLRFVQMMMDDLTDQTKGKQGEFWGGSVPTAEVKWLRCLDSSSVHFLSFPKSVLVGLI